MTNLGVGSCPFCAAPLNDPSDNCPQCHAGADWRDWANGMAFLRQRLMDYSDSRMLRSEQVKAIADYYQRAMTHAREAIKIGLIDRFDNSKLPPRTECWNCHAAVNNKGEFCPRCGSKLGSDEAQQVRYLEFMSRVARDLHQAGLLDLDQAHAIEADVKNQRQALSRRLVGQRARGVDLQLIRKREQVSAFKPGFPPAPQQAFHTPSQPASVATEPSPVPSSPTPSPAAKFPVRPIAAPARRSLLEILLDPQSIQWMLACGGVLLVVGVVIYLASKGLFENPRIVAGIMGLGSVAVLAAGWWILLKTRFHLAGRAVTLLACLAMPLNLWFYHAQSLMTLEGHLWVPATVICLLYAASAYMLRDPLFVYVMMGGVTMTGMLILVDLHRFMEIASPATLLMVLGLLCLHAERIFLDSADAPFSRKRFGMAFFWSAQALVIAALGLILGTQIVGRLWQPMFFQWLSAQPVLTSERPLKVLALALVCCGAYSSIWSSVVVRRKVFYTYTAAFTVLWAELLVIDLIGAQLGMVMIIGLLSLTALLAIGASKVLGVENTLSRPLRPLGFLLGLLSVVIGGLLHFRATHAGLHHDWPFTLSWTFVGMMIFAGLVNRTGAWANLQKQDGYARAFFFFSGGALLVAAAGLLSLSGLPSWERQSLLLILVPMLYLLASKLYGEKPAAEPTALVAEFAAGLMVLSVLFSALHISPLVIEAVTGKTLNLYLSAFCVEAAIFYGLLSIWRKRTYSIYLATAMLCGALWQVFGYFNFPSQTYVNAFALLGLGLLVVYRLAVLDEMKLRRLAVASFQSGNALLLVAFIASTLMTLANLLGDRIGVHQLMLTSSLVLISLLAAALVRASGWRRWYVTAAICSGATSAICLQQMSHLSGWQTMELFLVVVGLLLLGGGHLGWYREQGRTHSDMVSFSLPFGAILVCLPLGVAMFYNRFFTPDLSMMDEIGLLTASVLLFLTGTIFKLKDTTLVGGAFLAAHLIVLLVSVGMRAQLAVGVYLTAGGAVLFGLGLFLSLNRDRLLALPDRIRQREGMFRVLSWR